ncbi:unnamed protein product [Fusarium graminearum]|nr:unnamed protein product [Fusarium graminearum]
MACCIFAAFIIHRSPSALEYLNTQHLTQNHLEAKTFESAQNEVVIVDDEEVVTRHFTLSDLTCESCCTTVEEAVRQLPGVVKVSTSLLSSSATIIYKRRVLGLGRIRTAIQDAGYGVSVKQDDTELLDVLSRKSKLEQLKAAFRGAAILSALAWFFHYAISSHSWFLSTESASFLYLLFSLIPAWLVQLWFGRSIHIGAWWHGDKTNMDTLLSTSILLGLEISFTDFVFGTGIVLGGRCLNQALRAKATSKITALHEIRCTTSNFTLLPQRTSQPVFFLQPGDKILIPAGSVVPCDCYVTNGTSSVDTSLLTGEAGYQTKRPGDLIRSGSTNPSFALEAVATHPPDKSSLSRLVEAVRASSSSSDDTRGDIIPGLTVVTTYFARVVMTLAAIAFFATGITSLWAGTDWMGAWIAATRRAMLVPSVTCPCSLGLATPAATMAGINTALRHGVLVKGGLETLGKLATLTHMAFDKTGTLTRAGLEVSEARFFDGVDSQDLCLLLCAVEKDEHTSHIKRQFQSLTAQDLTVEKGKGVIGKVSLTAGKELTEVIVGSLRLLQESGILSEKPASTAHQTSTQIVYVGVGGNYAGYLVLENIVRPETPETLSRLRQLGLDVSLITGDNKEEAERVASIESTILDIQRRGGSVAMVGDGLNDLAAQSAADVSISVCAGRDSGDLGAALAFSSLSEVTLLSGADLNGLYEVIRIARKTIRQARINLTWALAYNTVGLLAALGCLEPIGIRLDVYMTGMIMATSSVSVLLLSQRVS